MKKFLYALPLLALFSTAHAEDVQVSIYNFQLKMAQRGHAEAAYNVARMSEEGRGTRRDLGKALEWYRQAAARGQADAALKVTELVSRTKDH